MPTNPAHLGCLHPPPCPSLPPLHGIPTPRAQPAAKPPHVTPNIATIYTAQIKSLLQTITNCENATKAASTADPTGAALLRSLLKEARAVMTGLGPGGDL